QLKLNTGSTAFDTHDLRFAEGSQLAGLSELGVFGRSRALRRADAFPRSKRIAMLFVDSEMLDFQVVLRRGKMDQLHANGGFGSWKIIVVIVPNEDTELAFIPTGQRGNVRFLAHSS